MTVAEAVTNSPSAIAKKAYYYESPPFLNLFPLL